jgi:hypothetical protein
MDFQFAEAAAEFNMTFVRELLVAEIDYDVIVEGCSISAKVRSSSSEERSNLISAPQALPLLVTDSFILLLLCYPVKHRPQSGWKLRNTFCHGTRASKWSVWTLIS